MLSARDCTPTSSSARRAWLAIGLVLCAAEFGCSRMRAGRRVGAEPPLLGVESRGGGYPNGEMLADAKGLRSVGEKAEPSARTSRSSASRHEEAIQVSLLPPTAPSAPEWKPAQPEAGPKSESTPDPEPGKAAVPASTPTVKSLLDEARAEVSRMTTYQVHLTRQERIGETLFPIESVVLSIRREPRAVRLEWPEGPHKGREVIYVAGGPMHVNDPHGLLPRTRLAPDSPLVLNSSRHPITEAGFETILARVEADLNGNGPDAGRPSYAGRETPDGIGHPCHKVVRARPGGETRTLYFDPETHLPALVILKGADGSLLESYRFDNLRSNVPELAVVTAFDPDGRWGHPQGLLSRLAGHPAATSDTMHR